MYRSAVPSKGPTPGTAVTSESVPERHQFWQQHTRDHRAQVGPRLRPSAVGVADAGQQPPLGNHEQPGSTTRVADRGPRERPVPVGRDTGRVELAPEPHRAAAGGTPVPGPSATVDHEQVVVVVPDRGGGRVSGQEPGADLDRAPHRLPVGPHREPHGERARPALPPIVLRSSAGGTAPRSPGVGGRPSAP